MDLGEYLKINLTSFLVRLDATNITFRVKYGYNRCMARVWDSQKWDINKRCQRHSLSNGLCKLHMGNISSGRVDEYPDERIVLRAYRKHRQNIDKEINIDHKNYYNHTLCQIKQKKSINLKIKKCINKNRMSLESIDNLPDIISLLYQDDNKAELKKKVVKDLKEKHDCYLTIAEDKKLITIIDEYLEKINTSNKISSKKNIRKISDEKPNINLDEYEIVKIIDAEFNECNAYYKQCEKNIE